MKVLIALCLKRPVGSERRRQRRLQFKVQRRFRQLRRRLEGQRITVTVENRSVAAFEFSAGFIGRTE